MPTASPAPPLPSSSKQDGGDGAQGRAQLAGLLMWRLQQWTDELCSSDGYNKLMQVRQWAPAACEVLLPVNCCFW